MGFKKQTKRTPMMYTAEQPRDGRKPKQTPKENGKERKGKEGKGREGKGREGKDCCAPQEQL